MATPTKPRSVFGHQLRVQLDAHPTIKSVRRLARVMNPEHPEPMRRLLSKWIAGDSAPTEESRARAARALGVDPSVFADEDDEEDPAMSLTLDEFLRRRIQVVLREETARDGSGASAASGPAPRHEAYNAGRPQ
jgi:transcriptional regulator with XRE-family HTH domain